MAFLLALLICCSTAPPEPVEPLRVVFISADAGVFTKAEEAEGLARAARALAFWEARAGLPFPLAVEHGGSFVAEGEVGPWLAELGAHDALTVYVVKVPPYPFGPVRAYALHELRYAVVTWDAPLGPEAVLAHELGHLLYGLADTYPCGETDVMCNPSSAYPHRLGCATLAQLGGRCWQVGLPIVGGGDEDGLEIRP